MKRYQLELQLNQHGHPIGIPPQIHLICRTKKLNISCLILYFILQFNFI